MSAPQRPTKATVEEAIRKTGGNLSKAAILLGISRETLYKWIYQLDLVRLAGVVPREAEQLKRHTIISGKVPMTVKVEDGLHRWVRIRAIETDQTISAVVEEALALTRAVAEAEKEKSTPGGR